MKKFISGFRFVLPVLLVVGVLFANTGVALASVEPTTGIVDNITTTSVTLHGINGDSVADSGGEAFWWGQSPVLPFAPCTIDCGLQFPVDWSSAFASTQDLSINGAFDFTVTGLTPNTFYYFVAWSQVGGTWSPSVVSAFLTLPIELTVSGTVTASSKTYDGTTAAVVDASAASLVGVSGTYPAVSLAGSTGDFSDKNVGTGKTVTGTLFLTGADAIYYSLVQPTTTADITAKDLTVSATGVNRVYDGTTAATVTLSDDKVGGDAVSDSYTSASFASANVGTGKAVSVTGISISGADAGNYTFNTTASTTANITLAPTTTTITCPVSVVYNTLAQTPCTALVTGAGGFSTSIPVGYASNTDVGIANASATFGGGPNHDVSSDAKTFTITPVNGSGGLSGGSSGGSSQTPPPNNQNNQPLPPSPSNTETPPQTPPANNNTNTNNTPAEGQVLGATTGFHFTLFLKQGSKGDEVMELQKFLNAAGYDCGAADGKFGKKTKAALIKFQIANGLKGDGVVGAKTREVLNK